MVKWPTVKIFVFDLIHAPGKGFRYPPNIRSQEDAAVPGCLSTNLQICLLLGSYHDSVYLLLTQCLTQCLADPQF